MPSPRGCDFARREIVCVINTASCPSCWIPGMRSNDHYKEKVLTLFLFTKGQNGCVCVCVCERERERERERVSKEKPGKHKVEIYL